jgi:hypothetical protein
MERRERINAVNAEHRRTELAADLRTRKFTSPVDRFAGSPVVPSSVYRFTGSPVLRSTGSVC